LDHPSEETLNRFAAGTAPREESRAVVAHLLKGCHACAAKIRLLMQPAAVAATSYEKTLDRFDRRVLHKLESAVGPEQAARSVPKEMVREKLLKEADKKQG
jgi:hypothetical protein